ALADLREAVPLKPEAVPAHINLALALRQRAEGAAWWDRALLQAEAVTVLDRAEAERDKAVPPLPRVAWLYHERGRLLLLLGAQECARKDFARAVLLAPAAASNSTLAQDLIELGRLHHKARDYASAVDTYQAVLRLPPALAASHHRAQALRLVALSLMVQRKYRQAGEALDDFLKTVLIAEPGRAPTGEKVRQLADAFRMRGVLHAEQNNRA